MALSRILFEESLLIFGSWVGNNYIDATAAHIGVFKGDNFTGAPYGGLFRTQLFLAIDEMDVFGDDLQIELCRDITFAQRAG